MSCDAVQIIPLFVTASARMTAELACGLDFIRQFFQYVKVRSSNQGMIPSIVMTAVGSTVKRYEPRGIAFGFATFSVESHTPRDVVAPPSTEVVAEVRSA